MDDYRLTTLPSGLRIATEAMPGVRSVSLGAWIGVGSRDEEDAVAGASHFLEHLLFRGTTRHTALEIAQLFDRFGAELNAMTTREYTAVYARVVDDHLSTAVDVIAGMLEDPAFEDFEAERDVILEEIAMYEDAPDDLVHDMIGELVFPEQGLGRPVIGFVEVLSSITPEAVRAHHAKWYHPANLVISAAGAVDHDAFVETIETAMARAPDHAPPVRLRDARLPPRPMRSYLAKETEQVHVCLGAPGIDQSDERRFASTVLDQILGGGASSRLFQEIRERRGMAYSVYSYVSHYRETGMTGVYVGTRAENVRECIEVIRDELRAVGAGRFENDEVDRARDAIKGRVALAMESTSARMSRLGKGLLTGVELLDEAEIAERVDAVSDADVAALAEEFLAPERLSAAGIGTDRASFEDALDLLSTPIRAA